MASDLNVGILGVGNIGTVHLQSALRADGVTVRGVADAVEENRRRARRLGAPVAVSDFRELFDRVPLDAVVVALPPFLHAAAAVEAARAGCHVFVEKPFARSVREARRVVRAADRAGVTLGVDHTIRYLPEIRQLKAAYDDGGVGHVPLCTISRVNSGPFGAPPARDAVPEWQLDPESTGGGAVMDLGVHLFDVLEWFFGEMTVRHAELGRQLQLPFEDTASVVLRSETTGTLAVLNCGFFQWEVPPDVNLRFHIEGVTGSLESGAYAPDSLTAYAARAALGNVWKRLRGREPDCFKPTYYYRAHDRALAAFLRAVADGRPPPVSGADGLRTLELVEATYAAADATAPVPEVAP